jgi:hypothetical protein
MLAKSRKAASVELKTDKTPVNHCGQRRLFEVPAPQAANSIQELQIEKRHWNQQVFQCP